jgi:hypothetical protein
MLGGQLLTQGRHCKAEVRLSTKNLILAVPEHAALRAEGAASVAPTPPVTAGHRLGLPTSTGEPGRDVPSPEALIIGTFSS